METEIEAEIEIEIEIDVETEIETEIEAEIEAEIEIPVTFMDDVPSDDDDDLLFLFHGSLSAIPESWEVEPAPAPAPVPPRLVRAPSRGRCLGYQSFRLCLI